MTNVELTFKFSSNRELIDFMSKLPESKQLGYKTGGFISTQNRGESFEGDLIVDEIDDLDKCYPDEIPDLPSSDGGVAGQSTQMKTITGKVTQKALSDAMREYKKANGHASYKAILDHFNVAQVRQIPKESYQDVMSMISGGVKLNINATMNSPATNTSTSVVATPEDLRQALSQHKAANGQPATIAVLNSLGYENPNVIPVSEYSNVIAALKKPVMPHTSANGIDLSVF